MKHKMSILFYVKSSKASKNGLLPIYQRITINGTRIELSTSKFVEKSKWNAAAGKIKGNSEEAKLLNSYLRTTQHYAKVLDRKVSDDMKILRDKMKNTNQKIKSG